MEYNISDTLMTVEKRKWKEGVGEKSENKHTVSDQLHAINISVCEENRFLHRQI